MIQQLKDQLGEARNNAERFRNSMYALEKRVDELITENIRLTSLVEKYRNAIKSATSTTRRCINDACKGE